MTRLFCLGVAVALASDLSVSAQPKDAPKKFTNSLGMEFALVAKGRSWLGGENGKEGTKEVNMSQDFYLGVYLVTQEDWEKVMGKNPSHFSRGGTEKDKVKAIPDADLKRFPVEGVSWEDARAFVKLVNEKVKKEAGWEYRLPTAEQWEYACRGGPMTAKAESAFDYYLEKPSKTLSKVQANFKDNGLNRPCKVGSYPPNRLGLYDMHGNVWEWCEVQLGEGVRRGGSWLSNAALCRAVFATNSPPSPRSYSLGLRLARVPSTSK